MKQDPARREILLRAAFDFLRKLERDDAIGTQVFYDAADCDGLCLRDDIASELDIEADAEPLAGRWTVRGDHMTKNRPDRSFDVEDEAESYADELASEGFENVTIEPATR